MAEVAVDALLDLLHGMLQTNECPRRSIDIQFWTKLHWVYRVLFALGILLAGAVIYARIDAERGMDQLVKSEWVAGRPNARELIVIVHGYVGDITSMNGVRGAARQARPEADLLLFEYPSQVFSNADTFRLAFQMEEQISRQQRERKYDRIVLTGFSVGALLLRKAYVYGAGSVEDAPFADGARGTTRPPQDWVRHVDRIVLLAGTNRGWSAEERPKDLSAMKSASWSLGLFIAKLAGAGRLARQVQRGEPFVANLRLQWLDVMEKARTGVDGLKQPVVIQLLGDRDDIVSKDDNRDVTVARDFIWVGVNNTGHADIINLEEPGTGAERKRKIQQALGSDEDLAELKRTNPVPASDVDPDVSTVVFVLHGIRDMGEWTSQFEGPMQDAFAARQPAGTKEKLYVHRAAYGYFPMGPFLLWADRQKNVRWFMDQVTELKARFPNLRHMHFIGHSNGTYVLASALQKYTTLKVDRVVFAGSVVRRDYPWSEFAGRVGKVRNYVGSDDAVVGIFPKLFELPGFHYINDDIGSAGFNGFEDGFVKGMETQFVRGGHPAALHPDNVKSIVDFVIDGKKTDVASLQASAHPELLDVFSRISWAVWLLIIVVIAAIGWALPHALRWVGDKFFRQTRLSFRKIAWGSRLVWAGFLLLILNTY